MKNRILSLCILLVSVVLPLSAIPADAKIDTVTEYPTFVTVKGTISEDNVIGNSQAVFELSLANLSVFDAGFSSAPVFVGTPPSPVQLVHLDQRKEGTDFFESQAPVYLYLRFFGHHDKAPTAVVSINSPLTASGQGMALDWKAAFDFVVNPDKIPDDTDPVSEAEKPAGFVLDSKSEINGSHEIKPIFTTQSNGLRNIVNCYSIQFETMDEFWKKAPDSFSSELWLKITSVL